MRAQSKRVRAELVQTSIFTVQWLLSCTSYVIDTEAVIWAGIHTAVTRKEREALFWSFRNSGGFCGGRIKVTGRIHQNHWSGRESKEFALSFSIIGAAAPDALGFYIIIGPRNFKWKPEIAEPKSDHNNGSVKVQRGVMFWRNLAEKCNRFLEWKLEKQKSLPKPASLKLVKKSSPKVPRSQNKRLESTRNNEDHEINGL